MYITVNGQQVEDGKGNNIFDENQGEESYFIMKLVQKIIG